MVREAEVYAAEDKKQLEIVEVKNNAASLLYNAEKAVKDLGEKAEKVLVEKVETAINNLKEILKTDDIEKIKAATEELTKPLYELSETVYREKTQEDSKQTSAQNDVSDDENTVAQEDSQ